MKTELDRVDTVVKEGKITQRASSEHLVVHGQPALIINTRCADLVRPRLEPLALSGLWLMAISRKRLVSIEGQTLKG